MTKKITEKEHLIVNELLISRLRNLYIKNIEQFHQIDDLLDLPLFINDRTNFNYSYFNETCLKLGEEVNFLNTTKKHSDLKSKSTPVLFENSKKMAAQFNKKNDFYATIKIPQEIIFNNQLTFFFSDKILLSEKKFLNLLSFPKQYGTIGDIIQDIIPNYAKDIVTWQRFTSLTKQEKIILKNIILGFSYKEISDKLNISYHTVSTHRKNIHKKLNVNNLAELIRVAIALDFFDFHS